MIRLFPIALFPDKNDRVTFMFGEAVHVFVAGLKNLPALLVAG
jgi:hypothetical protein